jgi:hypothetical protein
VALLGWKALIILLLIGLMVFAYIDDGPPYFEVSDLQDTQLHHEHIIVMLGLLIPVVVVWPPREYDWLLIIAVGLVYLGFAFRILG